jgi:hypothetical protein
MTQKDTIACESVEDGRRLLGARLDDPPVLDLKDELVRFYKRARFSVGPRNLIRAFDGYAIDGVAKADRSLYSPREVGLRAFSVIFTRFEGRSLGIGWGDGVMLATALACAHALGDQGRRRPILTGGWEAL